MRKAFGRIAGLSAIALSLAAIAAVLVLPVAEIFPVMIVLGPLMMLQYGYWRRRCGPERTTWQYLRAEPPRGPAAAQTLLATQRGDAALA